MVVSYYGSKGEDVTGVTFRYGEQLEPGLRGVWKQALPPGKFAINPYALKVALVPTVNFVLRWIKGVVEPHQYDKDFRPLTARWKPTKKLALLSRTTGVEANSAQIFASRNLLKFFSTFDPNRLCP